MERYTISVIGRAFGLSRSTLLYYDKMGLLKPSGRTAAGYRVYTRKDYRTLDRIVGYRKAGLALEEIRALLSIKGTPPLKILEQRFHEIGEQIKELYSQQHLLSALMGRIAKTKSTQKVDKAMWVEMLRSAGMDEKGMTAWHAEFEKRAPQAHYEFLLSLGISEMETQEIRRWAASQRLCNTTS
jgi:DNA-binding transcriptional MerR regulator